MTKMTKMTNQTNHSEFTFWEYQHSVDTSTNKLVEVFQKFPDSNSPLEGKTISIQSIYSNNGVGKKGFSEISDSENSKTASRVLSC